MASVAAIDADPGPPIEHYALPLDLGALFRFVPGSSLTADNITVIDQTGGIPGRWLRVRRPDKGDDLGDADVTITVSGNFWRRIPTATLTTKRTITLGTTNAAAGDKVTITRLDTTANEVDIVNGGPAAGTLATLPVSEAWWITNEFDGTNWLLHSAGKLP